jgi:Xaa-Pro aminopeptidase
VKDSFYEARLESCRGVMASCGLDGILLSSLENIRYLSGFTGSDGGMVLSREESFFLTDSRYWTQAEEEVKGSRIVHYKRKLEGIASLLSDLGLKQIGFEAASLAFSSHRSLRQKLADGARLVPLEGEIKNLRAIKDREELALIRTAMDIASRSFNHILGRIKEGVVERELALEMEFFMRKEGAEVIAFDIIVASGPRSALPHGKAAGKRIEKGDLVLIDYGSRFQGYHSDETCTVVCGDPTPEQRKVYQVVKDAHDRAIELIRPGIPLRQVDAAARDFIRDRGYGDYFGHSLGHGVGLAVHEEPAVNTENGELVQEGMVFTVEPGIYIPDWGGVRIEDMVLVTSTGAELVTYLPKELTVV